MVHHLGETVIRNGCLYGESRLEPEVLFLHYLMTYAFVNFTQCGPQTSV